MSQNYCPWTKKYQSSITNLHKYEEQMLRCSRNGTISKFEILILHVFTTIPLSHYYFWSWLSGCMLLKFNKLPIKVGAFIVKRSQKHLLTTMKIYLHYLIKQPFINFNEIIIHIFGIVFVYSWSWNSMNLKSIHYVIVVLCLTQNIC
jgi:hypothetical protein